MDNEEIKKNIVKKLRYKRYSVKQNQNIKDINVNLLLEKKDEKYHIFYLNKNNYTKQEIKKMIQLNKNIRLIAFNDTFKKAFICVFDQIINETYGFEKFTASHSLNIIMASDLISKPNIFPKI